MVVLYFFEITLSLGYCIRREHVGMKTGGIQYCIPRIQFVEGLYIGERRKSELKSIANSMNSNDMLGARRIDLNFFAQL